MKVVTTEMGRVIQVFMPDEVRPPKGLYIPEVVRLISERYGFGVSPNTAQTMQAGAKFQAGRLVSGDKKINIGELVLHNDAISVTTTAHTDEAVFVVQDFMSWAKEAFGIRDQITQKPKIFESHFVVDFDRPVDEHLERFAAMTNELRSSYKELYGYDQAFGFNRITFSVDVASAPAFPLLRTDLWIERRVGTAFSQNRYFSACGLPSDKHLSLLEKFERASQAKK
jgi:hypothetical protein